MLVITLGACSTKEDEKKKKVEEKRTEKFEQGAVSENENTYTNEEIGFKFNYPEKWAIASKEEMSQLWDLGNDFIDNNLDSDLADQFEKGLIQVFPLFMASEIPLNEAINGTSSIQVIIEKSLFSEEAYLKGTKEQLEAMDAIEYDTGDLEEVDINGENFHKLPTEMGDLTQTYYAYKMDEYMLLVIVTAVDADAESIMEKAVMSIEID